MFQETINHRASEVPSMLEIPLNLASFQPLCLVKGISGLAFDFVNIHRLRNDTAVESIRRVYSLAIPFEVVGNESRSKRTRRVSVRVEQTLEQE